MKYREEFDLRRTYSVPSRKPFYELALKYLPNKGIVVDIGSGEGWFADIIPSSPEREIWLLDGNKEAVDKLRKRFVNSRYYLAPEKLPFKDHSVNYMHVSHLVEHFYYEDLLVFLKEVDRVMAPGGTLIISAPLMWSRFYDNMSHIKPYGPDVFINYLVKARDNASASAVSIEYIVLDLVYRYRVIDDREWGSKYYWMDFIIRALRAFLMRAFGLRRYTKNGYTLVLKKEHSHL